MNFSQAEIRAMVFALAALKHEWFDWFEKCPEDIEFSYEEVESALMKVAAYNLPDDTRGATMSSLR
jgi:hypothetical protein